MPDREKTLKAMECVAIRAKGSVVEAQCRECPYYDPIFESGCDEWAMIIDALALLRDTTNPKGGSCSTCIHEYEPGSDYCLMHQKCKVCGICSGYEGGDGDETDNL